MRLFVVSDLDCENPTGRLDPRYFDPSLWATVDAVRSAGGRHGMRLAMVSDLLEPSLGVTSGATPLGAAYVENGVPFLRVQNVGRGHLLLDDVVYIDPVTHNDMPRSQLRGRDVLLTITGSIGHAAAVPESLPPANLNQHVARLRPLEGVEPDFLVGFLNSPLGQNQLLRFSTGSTRPALDYDAIRRTEIPLPSNASARSLSVYVRRELDRADAEATRAWGLLEGERAEVERLLRLPHLAPPTARSFVANEAAISERLDAIRQDPDYDRVIRMLERGAYQVVRLSDVASETTDTLRPWDDPSRSFVPIDLDNIESAFGRMDPPEALLGADFGEAARVRRLVPGHLAVNRLRFYLRKVAIIPPSSDWVGSTELYTFTASDAADVPYLWCALRQEFAVRQMSHFVTGSSRPRIESGDLLGLLLPWPQRAQRDAIVTAVETRYDEASRRSRRAEEIRTAAFAEVGRRLSGHRSHRAHAG